MLLEKGFQPIVMVEEKQVDAIRPKQHFHFCEWRFEKKMAQFFVLAVQRLLQSGFLSVTGYLIAKCEK